MPHMISNRLKELGIQLPEPPSPVASYVPFTTVGKLVFVSGQVPMDAQGLHYVGRLGEEISLEDGQAAARLCGLNILAQLARAAEGGLDNVSRIVRLGGFVRCTDDFKQQPAVMNGASDLMVAIFGDRGAHARAAVGVNALPGGVCVEVDAIAELA